MAPSYQLYCHAAIKIVQRTYKRFKETRLYYPTLTGKHETELPSNAGLYSVYTTK